MGTVTSAAVVRAIPLRRKLLYVAIAATIAAAIALPAAEIGLRLVGLGPLRPASGVVTISPPGMFRADEECGYAYVPGEYRFDFHSGYACTATIGPGGRRVTSPPDSLAGSTTSLVGEPAAADMRPEIWLFGCSYTFGYSVNDAETYAWRLQERFPENHVVNFAVDGYGTIQSLVQLQRELATGRRPRVAVLAYADFHDVRSIGARQHLKNLKTAGKLADAQIPIGEIDSSGELELRYRPMAITPFPLIGVSALAHTLERAYNSVDAKLRGGEEVGAAAIAAMSDACREAEVPFVLAGLTDAPRTAARLQAARDRGDVATSIYVDTSRPEYNNLPHDGHPSAAAHAIYAEKLAAALEPIAATRDVEAVAALTK